jgi:hypothetical protein
MVIRSWLEARVWQNGEVEGLGLEEDGRRGRGRRPVWGWGLVYRGLGRLLPTAWFNVSEKRTETCSSQAPTSPPSATFYFGDAMSGVMYDCKAMKCYLVL